MSKQDQYNQEILVLHIRGAQTELEQAEEHLKAFIKKTHEFDLWHSVRQDVRDNMEELMRLHKLIGSTADYMIREGG